MRFVERIFIFYDVEIYCTETGRLLDQYRTDRKIDKMRIARKFLKESKGNTNFTIKLYRTKEKREIKKEVFIENSEILKSYKLEL